MNNADEFESLQHAPYFVVMEASAAAVGLFAALEFAAEPGTGSDAI